MSIQQVNALLENAGIEQEQEQEQEETVEVEDVTIDTEEETTDEETVEDTASDDEQDTKEIDDEVTLQNLTQFADYLDISSEEAYGIEVPMPHGEAPITISALKDEVIEARRSKQVLEDQRSKFQDEVTKFKEQQSSLPNLSEDMLNVEAALRSVNAQINSTEWDKVEDPGQAALYRQQLNDAKSQLIEKRQGIIQTEQNFREQQFTEQANRDWQETIKAIPEWRDSQALEKDKILISKNINSYGFTDREVFSITDPRVIQLLRDYTLLKAKADTNSIEAKKVIKKGISVANRGKRTVSNSQKKQLASKINKAKRTGDRRDIADAVNNLING